MTVKILWVCLLWLGCCAWVHGDIFNWQTGELIPGTEGITPAPRVDLSHWNTAALNLRYADFENANLEGARFLRSWLDNAKFTQANLVDTFFFEARLSGADFSGAVVTGASFDNTTMGGFSKEQLYSTASYQDRNLRGIGLRDVSLNAWDFRNQDLTHAVFNNAWLSDANFTEAIVQGTDFGGTGLSVEQLYSTASHRAGQLEGIGLANNDLAGWSFAWQNLDGAQFSSSTLSGADFDHATVAGANFDKTTARGFTKEQLYATQSYQNKQLPGIALSVNDLSGWDFRDQDLRGASLSQSELTDTNFEGTNLEGATLNSALLNGADFNGAIIAAARLRGTTATGFTKEQLYSTHSYREQNLQEIGLTDNDLTDWNFAGQNLHGARFDFATLAGTDFTDAVVAGASFGATTSLGFTKEQLYSTQSYKAKELAGTSFGDPFDRSSDLSGWSFAGQNLSQASFARVALVGTDFSRANLNRTVFWAANLTDADLSGADLSGADFFIDLDQPWIPPAKLVGANLTDAIVTEANFDGTGVTQAQIYSTASYKQKDLMGIQLPYFNLSEWDFVGQNLAFANLAYSQLGGADLSDAVITGASFYGVTSMGFTKEQLYSTSSYQQGELDAITLANNELAEWDFAGQNLQQARLHSSNLTNADLSAANLFGASFHAANLDDVNLARADLRGAVALSLPIPTTRTENMIWPTQEIRGLALVADEELKVRGTKLADLDNRDVVTVTEMMTIEEHATLELVRQEWEQELGSFVSTPNLSVTSDVVIDLGGTLRLSGVLPNIGEPLDLFDWPEPLDSLNVFSDLEFPAGAWDSSNLYTAGEIHLVAEYQGDGDFDADGAFTATDIDRLSLTMRGGQLPSYDLTGDHLVNLEDHDLWVAEYAGTVVGDTNLDREVAFDDFLLLAAHYAQEGGWGQGDFDGDGRVLFGDFLMLSRYFGQKVEGATAVPEPTGLPLEIVVMLCTLQICRRRLSRRHESTGAQTRATGRLR